MVYIKLNNNLYNTLKTLVQPAQIVNCQREHYLCYPQFKKIALNHNLQIHKQIGRNDIITYNEMEIMIERQKQTPEQLRFIEQLKYKSQLRRLKAVNSKGSDDFYFQKKKESNGVKEMTQSISYSMAFIFSFFMAGLTGFYVGSYFLGWSLEYSLMIALAFIIMTIFVQTSLFILKQSKKSFKQKQTNNPQSSNRPVINLGSAGKVVRKEELKEKGIKNKTQ